MLTVSTIPEALSELAKYTGRVWTDSEIFDVVTRHNIELHAAPPITAQTTSQEFVIGEGLKEKFRSRPGDAVLAVLFPWQVQKLWISGETETSHPIDHDMLDGEYKWFTEPVRVTREQVRIRAASLQTILEIWQRAQPAIEPHGTPAEKVEDAQTPSPSDEDWMVQARVIADAIGLERWNIGIRQISARSICDAVATRLGENQRYWGTQGPRDSNAVRSVALKGWKFIPPSGTNGTNGINE